MATPRPSNTAKSRGKVQKKDVAPHGPSATRNPGRSRAQRDDTPEAREQARPSPKTHPVGRTPGARRRD